MSGYNPSYSAIIPEMNKGSITMNSPMANVRAGLHAGTTMTAKPQPYGLYQGGGGGDGGPMARILQFPSLQAQNPLHYANGNKQRFDETIPTSEPKENIPHPVKRKVRPLLKDADYPRVSQGEIVFIKQRSSHVNTYQSQLSRSGYGDEPATLVSLTQFNDLILREQIAMIDRGQKEEYLKLQPSDFLAEWRLDGIVEQDGGTTTWGGNNQHLSASPNQYYFVNIITKGAVETYNEWGSVHSGDRVYIVLKKTDWQNEYTLKNRFNGSSGITLKNYGENSLNIKPYQFCYYAITDNSGQLPREVTEYEDEFGARRNDGLSMSIGTVLHEPRLNPRHSNSYHPDNFLRPVTNANHGISDSTVTKMVLIYDSDGGANPF